tara:strand:- start:611 stop:1498 length:888 start_codon:yes stop_codon:yes gene_type:complete
MTIYHKIFDKITTDFKEYEMEDILNLPQYYKWPEMLLENADLEFHIKTQSSIYNEYEYDKWGDLYKQVIDGKATSIEEVRSIFFGEDVLPAKWQNFYYKVNGAQYSQIQSNLISLIIKKYQPENIIELGAGFGSMMFGVIKTNYSKEIGYYCGELTSTGRKLLKNISVFNGIELSVFECDFHKNLSSIDLPENSIIFTSLAICEVPGLGDDIIDKIIALKPKVVINLEAVYPTHTNTIMDLFVKKYIKYNNYNTTFQESLKQYSKDKRIKIHSSSESIIGRNPLRPVSLYVWSPT